MTGPQLKVSSDRLKKPVIEPATPGLLGKWFIHDTTATTHGGMNTKCDSALLVVVCGYFIFSNTKFIVLIEV